MATIMAVILAASGPPDALQIQDLPILDTGTGTGVDQVAAFGLTGPGPTRRSVWRRICPGLASSPTVKEP
jgi:hypothetical protein